MKNKIWKKYDTKNSLLVISGYPKKGELYSKGVCAVSSFTKNTLLNLSKVDKTRKIVVLTMVIDKYEMYEENGMLIIRCFKRNNPLSYINLLKELFRFKRAKKILLEFEFASFGDTFTTGLLAPLVWFLRINGKSITMVMHQVLSDIKSLSGHIGIQNNNIKLQFLNIFLKLFYIMLSLPTEKIIVLEEEFKNRLSNFTNPNKIVTIPHGIDTNVAEVSKEVARKNLGIELDEFVILYFGYLTWYKGVDFLINSLKDVNKIEDKKIRLVIAGGTSFTQAEKIHYKKFVKKVDSLLADTKNVVKTGFVIEEDIPAIFEASDLAVLPYRAFMSSSGPLSLAISYKKPFILSRNLENFTTSSDFKNALLASGLKKENILFALNKKSLIRTISMAMEKNTYQKMILFSKMLNKQRSFEEIAKNYNRALSENKKPTINAFYNFISAQN